MSIVRIDMQNNSKRIAKNTALLYVRMLLTMLVSLYTSRVILNALGVDDFGLYNIIGGIVVLFSFINASIVASTQRFINYELGSNNHSGAKSVFSASLTIHMAVAVVVLIISETIGLWVLNKYLNIPYGRELAANWVYQFTILTTCISIIRAPYNASIIAYERMSFYAYISIAEALLKLLIVFVLFRFSERLIAYSILTTGVAVVISYLYYVYCKRKFEICHYSWFYDRALYSKMISFSGWSLFGSTANVAASQGLNIMLNIFFGVAMNAAMGIANQVNAAIYQFVSNFQTAFKPQIVKSYAVDDKEYFIRLIINASKYSFCLLYLLSLPVFICCNDIMRLWLGSVPEHSVALCQLMILFSLIDALQGPLWVSVQATGEIKNYQMMVGFLVFLNVPLGYIVLKFTHTAELAVLLKVVINVVTAIARIGYLKRLFDFPVRIYLKNVIAKILAIVGVSLPIPVLAYVYLTGIWGIVSVFLVSLACTAMAIYWIGMNLQERGFLRNVMVKSIKLQ